MFEVYRKEIKFAGEKLIFETGKVARQADGAVVVTYGGTTVLCTATAAKNNSDAEFFLAKILDTSAIIDGRISDVSEVGFLEGTIILPQFLIRELQFIADSNDNLKKVRGRRGMETLKKMQDQKNLKVKIVDRDFTNIKEVDLKLVRLAKELNGQLVTNDFNLTKVANLQGVKVLNVNQLANSLRPVILPGEHMNIKVIKEGKDEDQGVGYLDDGTMVVIDNGKKHINKVVNLIITSVIQTPTGRMIFSKVADLRDQDNSITGVK